MALVSITILPFSPIPAPAHLPSLVCIVSSINDLVKRILVGTMVSQTEIPHQSISTISGTCSETSNTTFVCSCRPGWTDLHCQIQINYCANVTCLNNGVCQPLFQNYRCLCLGDSYSGQHCEIRANQLVVRETISRSFAYVTIIAISIVVLFIVTLDLLKYCLGIDPARKTSQPRKYPKKTKTRKSPVIIRFTYINASLTEPSTETRI